VKTKKAIILSAIVLFIRPEVAFAQSFTEYGRTLGGVGGKQRSTSSRTAKTQSTNKGKATIQGSEILERARFHRA